MKTKGLTPVAAAVLAAVLPCSAPVAVCGAQVPAALTGKIRSAEEGPMEGVVVSAKKADSTITISVASDPQGRYSFPRNKLEPGRYALSIRAVGYVADPASAEVAPRKTAAADLNLRKAQDIASQLSNGEWFMSMPGDQEQKAAILNCVVCHSLQRIVNSHHDTAEFMTILQRMSRYASGSTPAIPQLSRSSERNGEDLERFRKPAQFLSTINLSKGSRWEYPLKMLPRLKGRSTHVIVTEYDLPRKVSQPHDVILDSEGMAWYSDFGQPYIGKLNPKTGKVTEYAVPELKSGFPRGGLDLERDKEGNIWLSMLEQGGIARFNKETEKFQMFPLPKGMNDDQTHVSMLMPVSSHVDGKVWLKDDAGAINVHRLDLASGTFDTLHPYAPGAGGRTGHSAYGLSVDSHNNLYLLDMQGGTIVRADAKTGEFKMYPTPTPNSAPRRGRMDSQDRLWVGEFRGNKVAMFDTRNEQFQEWAMPTPWTSPYDAMLDKNGEVWTGGMNNDRIVRVDSKTGQATEYMLPHDTNIRRVFVDNSTTPVTFWVGNNLHASIVKVEPLD